LLDFYENTNVCSFCTITQT